MKPTSTATYILYNLRPSKQIERKLVFDTVATSLGREVARVEMPFIGMGGFRFVDFQVAHKMLGISDFVSIEHDQDIIPRCEFNKPFNNVEIRNETINEFLLSGGANRQAIVWLDYEGGLSENVLDETQTLTGSVAPGSYVFITCKGVADRSVRSKGGKRVRRYYEEQIGSFALAFREEHYCKEEFSRTAALLLRNMLADGFQGRVEGVFLPYLKLIYTDSTPMVTVGGYFGPESDSVKGLIDGRFPFLSGQPDHVYDVGTFNLTDAERRLFDRAALSPDNSSPEMADLLGLGFRADEVETYKHLMRYVPRYFEAFL